MPTRMNASELDIALKRVWPDLVDKVVQCEHGVQVFMSHQPDSLLLEDIKWLCDEPDAGTMYYTFPEANP